MHALTMWLAGPVAVVAGVASANAGPLAAGIILGDYNAVVYSDGSTQADIEGAAVIGGNFSGATVYNNPSATQLAGSGALTVYGNTSGNPINLDNGGGAFVGGNKGATINFNGRGGYIAASSYGIADFRTPLNALSQSLSKLAATAILPTPNNNEVIKAIPGANGMAVFNLSAAALAAIPSFSIDLNGASSVVFNVEGNSATFNANDQSGTNGANKIIWNFYDANTVAINSLIGGTVLAGGATVTNGNQIDGVLVANRWIGSGELHDWQFTGMLPSDPVMVPEPTSSSVLVTGLAGLAGLGLLRWRRTSPVSRQMSGSARRGR